MNKIVLIIDDEKPILDSLKFMLTGSGYTVVTAMSATEGLKQIKELEHELSVIITDLFLPGGFDGFNIIEAVNDLETYIPIIMITAYGKIDIAVNAMQKGAFTFLTKPIDLKVLLQQMSRAIEVGEIKKENRRLRTENLNISADRFKIIYQSDVMEKLLKDASEIAKTDATVLITGESGTGKEFLAHYILRESNRAGGPFLAFNAGAVSESLMESELFGYKKGAFTGAEKNSPGYVGAAEGGTLFIDEIGEMPMSLQTKLLRFLESKEYLPVGSAAPVIANVRVIAATNKNLEREIEKDRFRKDLYYRLATFPLRIPALRERREDIPLLISHFVDKARKEYKKPAVQPTPELVKELTNREWKGNVRELENYIRRFVLTGGESPELQDPALTQSPDSDNSLLLTFRIGEKKMSEIEIEIIDTTLKHTGGDKNLAAEILGISPRTIYRKISKEDEL